MVSFWPFKGDDTSAASFEKVLSQLSDKITKASTQNDRLRQNHRRYKLLFTLWTTIVYTVLALVLVLVTSWQTWKVGEYSVLAGGPVFIYGVRVAFDTYYDYRISNAHTHLAALQKQRDVKIEKLKAATKYNSTQKLLEKYGGSPPQKNTQSSFQSTSKRQSDGPRENQKLPSGPRTGFAPPPTANIPRPPTLPVDLRGPPGFGTSTNPGSSLVAAATNQPHNESGATEEFAPNAFTSEDRPISSRQQSTQYAAEGPKWFDRIMDVILGDDETQAKNRIALICQNCRLVNGQAPPGTRTVEDIGKWKCSSCHAWNGVESETKRMLKQISGGPESPSIPDAPAGMIEHAADESVDDDLIAEDMEVGDSPEADLDTTGTEHTSPAGSTRSKARQREKA